MQGVYSAYLAYCNMQNMQNMPWYHDDFCVFCILLHIFFHILHIFCTFLHIAAYFLPYSAYFLAYCFIFSFWNAALASTGNVWHDKYPETAGRRDKTMYMSLQNRFTFARQDFFELLIEQSINSSRFKDDQTITVTCKRKIYLMWSIISKICMFNF